MKEYTYYPGCSLEVNNKGYDVSSRAVAEALDIKLTELEDWNCCGATAYMSVAEKESFALAARNLAIAEKEKKELVTVCNACYTVLSKTNHYMKDDPKLANDIKEALQAANLSYNNTVKVRHLLDVLVNDIGEKTIKEKVIKPLNGFKVAPYYGCLISRPHGTFDDPEFPVTLDKLLTWVGASPVNFPTKTKCCGGMLMTTSPEVGKKLTKSILESAVTNEADCIATTCPLCHINLEAYQGEINSTFGTNFHVPIVYFTQLVGLALGIDKNKLMIKNNLISSKKLLNSVR